MRTTSIVVRSGAVTTPRRAVARPSSNGTCDHRAIGPKVQHAQVFCGTCGMPTTVADPICGGVPCRGRVSNSEGIVALAADHSLLSAISPPCAYYSERKPSNRDAIDRLRHEGIMAQKAAHQICRAPGIQQKASSATWWISMRSGCWGRRTGHNMNSGPRS
jgi:hypothetical protein